MLEPASSYWTSPRRAVGRSNCAVKVDCRPVRELLAEGIYVRHRTEHDSGSGGAGCATRLRPGRGAAPRQRQLRRGWTADREVEERPYGAGKHDGGIRDPGVACDAVSAPAYADGGDIVCGIDLDQAPETISP